MLFQIVWYNFEISVQRDYSSPQNRAMELEFKKKKGGSSQLREIHNHLLYNTRAS